MCVVPAETTASLVSPESTAGFSEQTAAAQLHICTHDSSKQVCRVSEAWWAALCWDLGPGAYPGDERWGLLVRLTLC